MPSWLSFSLGGLFTLGLFYFGVSRPTSEEIGQLRRQIDSIEHGMAMLAGHKGSVDETNHLLSSLGQQQAYATSARKTAAELQRLTNDLVLQSKQVEMAIDAIQQLASVKDLAVANADHAAEAVESLSAMEELQERLASSGAASESALRSCIDLLAIRNELLQDSYLNDAASEVLVRLNDLQSSLDSSGSNIAEARDRLDGLISLKDSVLAETEDLPESIATLEATQALQKQFIDASNSFKEIRHWMMEMASIQPLFVKVQSAIEPLTQLANVEKMYPQQLREFAKSYASANSGTRLASVPVAAPVTPSNRDEATSSKVE